jgi:hypothetical protein
MFECSIARLFSADAGEKLVNVVDYLYFSIHSLPSLFFLAIPKVSRGTFEMCTIVLILFTVI